MIPAELEQVRADIYAEPWNDPQLFPQLVDRTLTELGKVATGERYVGEWGQQWADELLRTFAARARTGEPWGEPQEPAWSLDPDPNIPTRSAS